MANKDDFFNKAEDKTETETKTEETKESEGETKSEVETIKVGEEEYTQEDLAKLVGLGKLGQEAEEKFNVKLDKVWPNLQQTINDKKQLEEELNKLKTQATQPKAEGEQTEEQVVAQAKAEAKKLGLISVDDVNEYVDRRIEARELRSDVQSVVDEGSEKYGIKSSEEAVLNHMVETGIRNPEKAFKDMYEDKIDTWKENQIKKAKPQGMVTDDTATAGAKQPKTEKVNKDNFFSRMDEVLGRES